MNTARENTVTGLIAAIGVVVICAVVIFGSVAGCGAYKNWHRGQKRADARNAVAITHIKIQQAQQQAKIVHAQNAAVAAKAQQRYIEAVGIRRAQDEISKTLTPLYIQHEAIQAQERIATSGQNNTAIYIPAGQNGVPLVNNVGEPLPKNGASK